MAVRFLPKLGIGDDAVVIKQPRHGLFEIGLAEAVHHLAFHHDARREILRCPAGGRGAPLGGKSVQRIEEGFVCLALAQAAGELFGRGLEALIAATESAAYPLQGDAIFRALRSWL